MTEQKSLTISGLLRSKQAAVYLGISAWKLRQLVNTGRLAVVQYEDGAPWLFRPADLDAYISANLRVL